MCKEYKLAVSFLFLTFTWVIFSFSLNAQTSRETIQKRKIEKYIELGSGDFSITDNINMNSSDDSLTSNLLIKNSNAGTSAGTRLRLGNNNTDSGLDVQMWGSNHSTLPNYARILNQQNAPLQFGANGNLTMSINTNGDLELTTNNDNFVAYGDTVSSGVKVVRDTTNTDEFGLINYFGGALQLLSSNTGADGIIIFNGWDGSGSRTEYARFDSSGNFGIGVTPSTLLHVKETVASTDADLRIEAPSGFDSILSFQETSGTDGKIFLDGSGNLLTIEPNTNGLYLTEKFILKSFSTDNTIDTSSNGSASTTMYIGNASINVTVSDRKAKKNIRRLQTEALTHIRRLSPLVREWDWKDENMQTKRGHTIGMVAQELYEEYPGLVVKPKNEDDYGWSIRYHEMVGITVKAIDEIQDLLVIARNRIKALKTKVDQQELDIEDLKTKGQVYKAKIDLLSAWVCAQPTAPAQLCN